MPKSKQRKNHKQKVSDRNKNVENAKKQAQNAQREFINNLIKKEQESGKFENNPELKELVNNAIIVDGPTL